MFDDRNDLSFWHPLLVKAHIPVPETKIIDLGPKWPQLARLLEGRSTPKLALSLAGEISAATSAFGLPVFLRTGYTSGKHFWEETCYLKTASIGVVLRHIAALVEFSECAGIVGLPYQTWAVRRWLTGRVAFAWTAFKGLPVRREFRVFAKEGTVQCIHGYWPQEAFRGLTPWQKEALKAIALIGEDEAPINDLASRASAALGKDLWSIDVLEAEETGWHVIDCALGQDSFHWKGCPYATAEPRTEAS